MEIHSARRNIQEISDLFRHLPIFDQSGHLNLLRSQDKVARCESLQKGGDDLLQAGLQGSHVLLGLRLQPRAFQPFQVGEDPLLHVAEHLLLEFLPVLFPTLEQDLEGRIDLLQVPVLFRQFPFARLQLLLCHS